MDSQPPHRLQSVVTSESTNGAVNYDSATPGRWTTLPDSLFYFGVRMLRLDRKQYSQALIELAKIKFSLNKGTPSLNDLCFVQLTLCQTQERSTRSNLEGNAIES